MDVSKINVGIQINPQDYNSGSTEKVVPQDNTQNNSEANDGKKKSKPSMKEIDKAVESANRMLFKNNTHLQFSTHKVTKDVMVKIVDDQTGEVVKEIPPEKFVDMIAKLCEMAGIFVDEKR